MSGNSIPARFYSGADLFPLMAMPLFILAGEIMNRTKITHKVIDFANTLVNDLNFLLNERNNSLASGNIPLAYQQNLTKPTSS